MERLLSERFLVRKSCAIGAAVLIGAIGIGLALLNRLAGSDGEAESLSGSPEPIEGAGSRSPDTDGPPSGAAPEVSNSMTRAELYEIATELGIKGRSSMNKAGLIEAIRSAS